MLSTDLSTGSGDNFFILIMVNKPDFTMHEKCLSNIDILMVINIKFYIKIVTLKRSTLVVAHHFLRNIIFTSFAGLLSLASLNAATNTDLPEDAYNWTGRYRLKTGAIIEHTPNALSVLTFVPGTMFCQRSQPAEYIMLYPDGSSHNIIQVTVKSTHESFVAALIASGLYHDTVHEVITLNHLPK